MSVTPFRYSPNMCSTCERYEARMATGKVSAFGPVAQPGRAPAWHAGSRRFESGQVHLPDVSGYTMGGFVAGEGCFCTARLPAFADGSRRLRFLFTVEVVSRDRSLLEQLRALLAFGSICDRPGRRPGHQPTSHFRVSSFRAHREATIPFAERYLLPSAKRRQFDRWRAEMEEYLRAHSSRWGQGPSPCSVAGCGKPVRGQGLCRSHYYRATGY